MITRINGSIRNHVMHAIRDEKFDPQESELKAREPFLFRLLYDHAYPQSTQDLMNSLPPGYLREQAYIGVYIDGQYHQLYNDVSLRFPFDTENAHLPSGHGVAKHIRKWQREKDAFQEAKDEAMRSVRAMLASHRTVQALVKSWPEVEPYLPKADAAPITTALAVPVKQLNKMLRLP